MRRSFNHTNPCADVSKLFSPIRVAFLFLKFSNDVQFITQINCRKRPDFVRLGDMNLSTKDDDDGVQEFEVADVIPHPEYNSSTLYNDIALIRLSSEIK